MKKCIHEESEKEIGYDIKEERKNYYCTKCGKKTRSIKMKKEIWNKENPELII